MMGPSWYRSAFRTLRGDVGPSGPPSVSSPVGAQDNTTAAGQAAGQAAEQAAALRQPQQEQREPDVFDRLPAATRQQLQGGYAAGGFEGVRNTVGAGDWYDLPEHVRRGLLSRMTGGV